MAHSDAIPIFAPTHAPGIGSLQEFHLFPNLPIELRVKIWLLALRKNRIIKLCLRNRLLMDSLLVRQDMIRPDDRDDEQYGVVVDGPQIVSKFFRVNRESRGLASSFYRVKIPSWFVKGPTKHDHMNPGVLHFNPEHDFLYINNDTGQVVEFLHDLKTVYDPRKVGLLNLAIDFHGLIGGYGLCGIDPSTLDPALRASFDETLLQLREVFFIQVQRAGRHVYGYSSGAPTNENKMNLSFPIRTTAPTFERLDPDPRSIRRDLGEVFVNADPRCLLYSWGRLFLSHFGRDLIPQTEYKVLLTFTPMVDVIHDAQDAKDWLQKETDFWRIETSKDVQSEKILEESLEAGVAAAFGFWLFPAEAFGDLPENPTDPLTIGEPRFINMRNYWPELGLSCLN